MDRAATALLDSRDEAERRQRADQELLANRQCRQERAIVYGAHATITWAPDGKSLVSESRDESIARWAGFNLLDEIHAEREDESLELIWWGTRPTEAGTFVAQFEVMEGEE